MSDGHGGRDDDVPPSAGDPTARWQKIWATRELLVNVARLRGAGPDAEDVAQEAMARAIDHPEVEDQGLQAWLVTVTTRLCVDAHRRRTNERVRWQHLSGQAGIVQPGQNVEEEACARSEAVWVAHLVTDLLPPRQVRALELTAAGFDVQQVATTLDVPYRAAESLLARARRTIRAAISTSLGAAVWAWRPHLPGNSGSWVSVALASAATTATVVFLPPVVSWLEPPAGVPAPVASVPAQQTAVRTGPTHTGSPAAPAPVVPAHGPQPATRAERPTSGPAAPLPTSGIRFPVPDPENGAPEADRSPPGRTRSDAGGPPGRPTQAQEPGPAKAARPGAPPAKPKPPLPPAGSAGHGKAHHGGTPPPPGSSRPGNTDRDPSPGTEQGHAAPPAPPDPGGQRGGTAGRHCCPSRHQPG